MKDPISIWRCNHDRTAKENDRVSAAPRSLGANSRELRPGRAPTGEHYHKSPDLITEEELRQYFLYLKNVKHYAPTTTIAICGIKFFFERTLEKDWTTFNLVRPAPEKKLPVILSREEVRQILRASDCRATASVSAPSTPAGCACRKAPICASPTSTAPG